MEGTILLPVFVFSVNLVQVAVNIFLFSQADPVTTVFAEAKCLAYLPLPDGLRTKVVATARTSTICSDLTVLVVTWTRTYRIYREAAKVNIRLPVTILLIRDGTLYFLVVLLLNLTHVIVFHTQGQIFLVSFICALSAVLASRFLLNFRQLGGGGGLTELSRSGHPDVLGIDTPRPAHRAHQFGDIADDGEEGR